MLRDNNFDNVTFLEKYLNFDLLTRWCFRLFIKKNDHDFDEIIDKVVSLQQERLLSKRLPRQSIKFFLSQENPKDIIDKFVAYGINLAGERNYDELNNLLDEMIGLSWDDAAIYEHDIKESKEAIKNLKMLGMDDIKEVVKCTNHDDIMVVDGIIVDVLLLKVFEKTAKKTYL